MFFTVFALLLFLPTANLIRCKYDGSGYNALWEIIFQPIAWAVAVSWLISAVRLLLELRHRYAALVWTGLIGILLFFNCLVDLGCYLIYESPFTNDLAGVLLVTNLEESAAFISSFLNLKLILWMVGTLGGSIFLGWFARWLIKRLSGAKLWIKTVIRFLASWIIVWSMIQCLFLTDKTSIATNNIVGKMVALLTINVGHEVVLQHPELILDQTDVPEKIVVIIGESHSRSHSQLYGYPRENQPRLSVLAKDSSLVVFADPVSPAANTLATLQRIIGTYEGKDETGKEWYEYPTWIETSKLAGYQVKWLSNQSPKGVYDNPVFKLAELTDKYEFTTDGMSGISSRLHDEHILPVIDRNIEPCRQVLIVHLMGSHLSYNHSYPLEERHFLAKDYPDLPEHQRKEISDYDNSILYNDRIVSEIMEKFKNQDAVVIYFSDHGQDLYDSDPEYRGHSRINDKASMEAGRAIPFYIYLSPVFVRQHPLVAERIRNAAPRGADTDNLIYTIMDLTGARFADDPDIVAEKSIIR